MGLMNTGGFPGCPMHGDSLFASRPYMCLSRIYALRQVRSLNNARKWHRTTVMRTDCTALHLPLSLVAQVNRRIISRSCRKRRSISVRL